MNQDEILLISCYELGHQPSGIFIPLALLEAEGYTVNVLDISVSKFDPEKVLNAKFVGISVPMHTALRLGVSLAEQIRKLNPNCHICFYGLYALSNADYLLSTIASSIIGGEFEEALVKLVHSVLNNNPINIEGVGTVNNKPKAIMKRLKFAAFNRKQLPELSNYARLVYQGEERLTGYVEASRGCLHHCTHCPIPTVYKGKFFVIPKEIILSDVRQLINNGAKHITFGDPDFLNGPNHSLQILTVLHKEFPELTFDFTTKVEHILKHQKVFPELSSLGVIFIVSALESFSNKVLSHLEKGHTHEDIISAWKITNKANIALRPTFVSFTPWTTLDDYLEMLETIVQEGLIEHVDPVQYTIRLLIPPASLILEDPSCKDWLGSFDQKAFSYEWKHPDKKMDKLYKEVSILIENLLKQQYSVLEIFSKVVNLAREIKFGTSQPINLPKSNFNQINKQPPKLTESWFC